MAGVASRDLCLDFLGEQISFLQTRLAIAAGFVDVDDDVGLSYVVKDIATHARAIVEAEAKIAALRLAKVRLDEPSLIAEGDRVAKIGKEALSSFWRALTTAQRLALGCDRRDSWANIARVADEERAAWAGPKEAAA